MSLIVIVDDRATNRTIYSQLAKSIGQNVVVKAFADPGEALVWLEGNRADLIVTDYDMPKIDGGEFISRFRSLAHGQSVPIIMLTVCEQKILRLRALESGANDFLNTPIDHNEFLMRARNLLQLGRAIGAEPPQSAPQRTASAPEPAETSGHAVAATSGPDAATLLAQCGDGHYALHVLDPGAETGPPPSADFWRGLLRALLRAGDGWAPLSGGRCLVLQKNVVAKSDAEACAARLRSALRGALRSLARVGTAMPRMETAGSERAAHCLGAAEARAVAPSAGAASIWRVAPMMDLRAGVLAGGQLLREGEPADAADAEALGVALDILAGLDTSFRLSLSWNMAGDAGPAQLRLAAALAAWGVASQLDLRIAVESFGRRAEEKARTLRGLGLGLTLALGDETRTTARGGKAFALACCDRIAVSGATSAARMLGLRKVFPTLPILVLDVSSAADLRDLRRAGVSLAQGDCFGAPLAPQDLAVAADAGCRAPNQKKARRA